MRLDICDLFLLWNLHSVSLRKNSVYLHKRLTLGLGNHHVDVNSGEEADPREHDEAVGPNGRLGQETGEPEGAEAGRTGAAPGGPL